MSKKGISEWAKDLKHNPKVAKKFMGVKTVSDILSVAKENGYEITENELMDPDLNTVAGGVDPTQGAAAAGGATGGAKGLAGATSGLGSGIGSVNVTVNPNIIVNTAVSTATATAQGATAQSNPTMTISSDIGR
ncbi:MAG: Nif11-like leader peptide family RiPP precursor [Eubacteriales bacterium SKADARSKE-1]|nr:Nif11-like leader peptide family RiPP precursor [Eubacteriales bacterium SKADARSKE-1]